MVFGLTLGLCASQVQINWKDVDSAQLYVQPAGAGEEPVWVFGRGRTVCVLYVCLCVSMSIHLSSPLSVSFSLALSISFFHRFNSPLSLRAICRIQQPVTVSVPVSCLSVYLSFSTSFTIPSSLCLSDCLLSLGHSFLSPPPFSLSLSLSLSLSV